MALILIRYVGEIGIKGKNRGAFVRRLRRNLRGALKKKGIPGRVWSENQRVYAEIADADRQAALDALQRLSALEGILPALESAHAVAEAIVRAPQMRADQTMIVNVSGRGDKDMMTVAEALGFEA